MKPLSPEVEATPEKYLDEPVPAFPIQLADVYLYDCTVVRRDVTKDDPTQPTFLTSLDAHDQEDLDGFVVQLSIEVGFRFRDEAVAQINARVNGVFVRIGPLDADEENRFREADSAILLWPYARAIVGDIARAMDIGLPPLPTVDVRDHLHQHAVEPA